MHHLIAYFSMLLLEASMDNLAITMLFIILLLLSPAFIALLVAFIYWRKKPKMARYFLLFAVLYFLIGLGICGSFYL